MQLLEKVSKLCGVIRWHAPHAKSARGDALGGRGTNGSLHTHRRRRHLQGAVLARFLRRYRIGLLLLQVCRLQPVCIPSKSTATAAASTSSRTAAALAIAAITPNAPPTASAARTTAPTAPVSSRRLPCWHDGPRARRTCYRLLFRICQARRRRGY